MRDQGHGGSALVTLDSVLLGKVVLIVHSVSIPVEQPAMVANACQARW